MRKVEIGNATLIHGDCFEVLPELSGFDGVGLLTDPPYGLGRTLSGGGKSWGKTHNQNLKWDMFRPDLTPILNLNLPSIVWGGNYFNFPISRCWLIWNKPQRNFSLGDAELAWTNQDKPVRSFDCSRNPDGEREHPTQKPVKLMKWCISHLPKDCDTILDPFMGSGSTGIAAFQMGKAFIGIEKDEEYFEIACKRIRDAHKQPDMFLEAK